MNVRATQDRNELVVYHSGRGTRVRVIRALVRGETILRVEWYVRRLRKVKDYADTAKGFEKARAFAQSIYNTRLAGTTPTRLAIGEMWRLYQKAEFSHLSQTTRDNYTHAWKFFEHFFGQRFFAENVTHERLDDLRDELRKRRKPPLSVRMVQDIFGMIRRVYRWADGRELIGKNRPGSYRYKIAKSERTRPRDEYEPDDRDRLLEHLDPNHYGDWRGYVALVICGMQGARQHAVLHLTWPDIDHEAGMITWQAAWDKMGKTWEQPIRVLTREALNIAHQWRTKIGYTGLYIIPPARTHSKIPHFSKQSLAVVLRKAEARAGIPHKPGRGPHGLRRTVSGDVSAESGDPMLGLHAIGDSDARMASKYIKARSKRIKDVFDALDQKRNK